jgi:carbonic anhydrase
VEGQTHAMEAHFVHKNDQGRLAVVGVIINRGKENAALKAV